MIDSWGKSMSSSDTSNLPRGKIARITGGLYLAFVLALVLADTIGHIGIGEVEQAYEVLTVNPWQFTLGIVFHMLSAFLFFMAAWGLYVLLKPVNQDLALLFLLLNAIGVAIQVASLFPLIFATLLADGSSFMQAFSAAQIADLQYVSIGLQAEFRRRTTVLRHLAVPARLPCLQVGIPP